MGKTPKKIGRPTKEPEAGERVPLGLRVTATLKRQLDSAAEMSGRSQSQEAEFRLERSFAEQHSMIEALELTFGRDLAGVLLMIGHAMHDTGRDVGFTETGTLEGSQNWLRIAPAFDQASKAAERILQRLRPAGEPALTSARSKNNDGLPAPVAFALENPGVALTNSIMMEAATGKSPAGSLEARALTLHRLAGPLLTQIAKQRKAKS